MVVLLVFPQYIEVDFSKIYHTCHCFIGYFQSPVSLLQRDLDLWCQREMAIGAYVVARYTQGNFQKTTKRVVECILAYVRLSFFFGTFGSVKSRVQQGDIEHM